MHLSCAVTNNAGEVTVTLAGNADLATVDALRAALADATAGRPARITVDLLGLTFIDSISISALIVARRAAQTQGIVFTAIQPRGYVRKALTLTGVLDTLTGPPDAGAA
ncbi:STAS domain-containing protein [Planosporangium sp. 12N6]|uniref:STAS domain-containing protein n=1 Tax=Planosporangium spinosum TaxID=3402278 RepID=UPI003CE84E36